MSRRGLFAVLLAPFVGRVVGFLIDRFPGTWKSPYKHVWADCPGFSGFTEWQTMIGDGQHVVSVLKGVRVIAGADGGPREYFYANVIVPVGADIATQTAEKLKAEKVLDTFLDCRCKPEKRCLWHKRFYWEIM